jgi:FkbM family methyltransferase
VCTVNAGFQMELDGRDEVTGELLRTGEWEASTGATLREHLHPADTFVDVGCHVGYFSLLASQLVGESGQVISIEANPNTADRAQRNIAINGTRNITLVRKACGDETKELAFHCARMINSGGSSLAQANAGRGSQAVVVQAVTLDSLLVGIPRISLMKVDVEGFELPVLRGAVQTLEREHPALVLELKPELLVNANTSEGEARAWLAAHGYYEARQLDRWGNALWLSTARANALEGAAATHATAGRSS